MSRFNSNDLDTETHHGSTVQNNENTHSGINGDKYEYHTMSMSCGMDVIERKSYYGDVKPRPSLSSYKNNLDTSSQNERPDSKKMALSRRINSGNLNNRLCYLSENCSIKKKLLKSASMNDKLDSAGKNLTTNGHNLKCIPESHNNPTENTFNLNDINKKNINNDLITKNTGFNKWNSSVSLNVYRKINSNKIDEALSNVFLMNNNNKNENLNTRKIFIKNEINNKTNTKMNSKNINYKNNENYNNIKNMKIKNNEDISDMNGSQNSINDINNLVLLHKNSLTNNCHTTTTHQTSNNNISTNISNNNISISSYSSDIASSNSNNKTNNHINYDTRKNNFSSKNYNNINYINSKLTTNITNNNNPITNNSTNNNAINTRNYIRTKSSDSSSSCPSRRLLPNMPVPEQLLEQKRNILSKRLEQKMIRKVSGKNSSKNIKSGDDSEENRSLTSYEVAGILERAGPMGVCESDYEELGNSMERGISLGEEEDEEEELYKSKKNKMTSLFDAMKNDLLISDAEEDGWRKGAFVHDSNKPGDNALYQNTNEEKNSELNTIQRGFMPYSKPNIPSKLPMQQGIDNTYFKNDGPSPLSLFVVLQSGSFSLIPVTISSDHYLKNTFNNNSNNQKHNQSRSNKNEGLFKISKRIICLELPTKSIKTRSSVIKVKYSAMVVDESYIGVLPPQQFIQIDDILLEVDGYGIIKQSCLSVYSTILNLMASHSTINLVLARKCKS